MGIPVFFIGATGHIGAAVLDKLKHGQPFLSFTALVRSEDDIQDISEQHIDVKTVHGSLEDENLIQAEASRARLVINCAPDVPYSAGISAILRGLESRKDLAFYIHTSGAARIGEMPIMNVEGRVWDDVEDFDYLPTTTTHTVTDKLVAVGNSEHVHAAVISPPFVIGASPSRTHPAPLIFPDLVHVIRELGCGFGVSNGKNMTSFVDVHKLAELYMRLVDNALRILQAPQGPKPDPGIWGPKAYYFLSSLDISFADFMTNLLLPTLEKHRVTPLKSWDVKDVTIEELAGMIMGRVGADGQIWSSHLAQVFAENMRPRGSRAKTYLGFVPGPSPGMVDKSVAEFSFMQTKRYNAQPAVAVDNSQL